MSGSRLLLGLLLAAVSLCSQDMIKVLKKDLRKEVVRNSMKMDMMNDVLVRLAYRSPESIPYYIKYLEFSQTGDGQDSAIIYHDHSKRLEFLNAEAQRQWQMRQLALVDSLERSFVLRQFAKKEFRALPKSIEYDTTQYHDPAPMPPSRTSYFAVKLLLKDPEMSYVPGNDYWAIYDNLAQGLLQSWNESLENNGRAKHGLAFDSPINMTQYYQLMSGCSNPIEEDPVRIKLKALQKWYARGLESQYRVNLSKVPLTKGSPFSFSLSHSEPDRFQLNKVYSGTHPVQGWVLEVGRKFYINPYSLPFSYVELGIGIGDFRSSSMLPLGSSVKEVGEYGSSYYETYTADSNRVNLDRANTVDLRLATPLFSRPHLLNMEFGIGVQYLRIRSRHEYTLHWELVTKNWSYETSPPILVVETDSWDGDPVNKEFYIHEISFYPFLAMEITTPLPYLSVSTFWNGNQSAIGLNYLF